ncbi:MAG: threonine/serine dehydratase [Pseudomonadota bacterium]|nr:threonine/serine dehydratase [Pseudomonadota bacterium]
MVSTQMIYDAYARLSGNIRKTPILSSPFLDKIADKRLLIKAECLQHTGSFKYRGAWSAISALDQRSSSNGVIAYSSGNHAQAVAAVAKSFGLPAVIVMPSDAPKLKIENTKYHGAEVVLYNRLSESREEIGSYLAKKRNLTLIRPYEDPLVIAGQGTLGVEMADQLDQMGVKTADILVCCGGGGLSAGVTLALKDIAPELTVRPCEPKFFDDTTRSLLSGKREFNDRGHTSICDAILTPTPGENTFRILRDFAGAGLVVSDEEVLEAMVASYLRLKLVIEPGGAVALASALFRKEEIQGDTVVAIVTGGNVDFDTLKLAFNSGRKRLM